MINIDQLVTFYNIVKAGSLTEAKDSLGVNVSSVSSRLKALEVNLNTVLMHRNKAGIQLTSQGRLLFEFIKDLIPKLNIIEEVINSDPLYIKGPLKITTWHGVASFMLPNYVIKFGQQYPDILVNLAGDNQERKFIDYHSDALILPYSKQEDGLDQFKVFSIQFHLYASKTYLETYGMPKTMNDLKHHRLIGTTPFPQGAYMKTDWHLFQGTNQLEKFIKPHLVINSSAGVFYYCIHHQGIGAFPDYYISEKGQDQLVRLFPEFQPPSLDFYYIYEKSMGNIPRIRAFGDFLLENVPKLKKDL